MTVEEFRRLPSVQGDRRPPGDGNSANEFSPALVALWHDAHGNWDAAHESCQKDPGLNGAWVHAYLHRQEGDLGNAAYWYRRANRPVAQGDLESEWTAIAQELLR